MGEKNSTEDSRRGFWCLIGTQFQVAFSDNVLKNLVIFMMLGMNVSIAEKENISSFVSALFALPFILFLTYGGYFADRFSKRSVTIAAKNFEFAVVGIARIGLAGQNRTTLPAGIFLMGVLAAFFGPSKYGLLPELLPEIKLSWGNVVLEFGANSAIIPGTVAASYMHHFFGARQFWSGLGPVGVASAGFAASLGVSRVPAADPRGSFA